MNENHKINDLYADIPGSSFAFAERNDIYRDKKFSTRPVGYFRGAWRRFGKNGSSVAGMAIILFLILFSVFAPLLSSYKTTDVNGNYQKVLPKLSSKFDLGFWNGTRKVTQNKATYEYYEAMGKESGRNPVRKTYKSYEVTVVVANKEKTSVMYDFRLDSYLAVGYKFLELSKEDYLALQDWQRERGKQVIYPIQNTSTMGSGNKMYDATDANYWYATNAKGEALRDEKGDLIPLYKTSGDDAYDSLRIEGDPGIADPSAANRYRYGEIVQGGLYRVRVCYYDYYIYRNGKEPCYVLGATGTGQDLMVLIASGMRFSLLLGIGVAAINLLIGGIYGAIEGYYGGTIDLVMERISDVLNGIPFMVVAILFNLHLAAKTGAIPALLFAFVLTGWIGTASTVRMQFYRYKKQEYVLAARTLGARDRRIILKHIYPNALGTLVTSMALSVPGIVFSESMLSYLGIISLDDPATGLTTLGTLLSNGRSSLSTYPHIILFPALVISLLMISFNLFGNGLRDAFNPSLRGTED